MRSRCQKTFERRAKVIAMLRDGRRVQTDRLKAAVMPDRSKVAFQLMIREMRADGYRIEADGRGHCCRGYRLISEPRA